MLGPDWSVTPEEFRQSVLWAHIVFFWLLSVAVAKNRLHTFIRRAMNINKKWAPGSKRWKGIDILKEDARIFIHKSFDSSFAPFYHWASRACVRVMTLEQRIFTKLLFHPSVIHFIVFFNKPLHSCKGDRNPRLGVHGSLCCCFCLIFCKLFPHGQNYKCNLCASSHRVHAPLSSPLDEMTGFRDKRQPLPPTHPSPCSFQHSGMTDAWGNASLVSLAPFMHLSLPHSNLYELADCPLKDAIRSVQ